MSYCVLFCILYRKESANKRLKRYRNTVNNLISPNTVSQNDEKPHTAELDDTAIPHVKIKITEIPHEKKPNTEYRKPPCPPQTRISKLNVYTRNTFISSRTAGEKIWNFWTRPESEASASEGKGAVGTIDFFLWFSSWFPWLWGSKEEYGVSTSASDR